MKTACFILTLMLCAVCVRTGNTGTQNQPIIDSIEIHNNNIYDKSNPDYRHWIFSLANKLHMRTRKSVISGELLLHVGDRFDPDLAEETARNLRSLHYIWNARADLIRGDDGSNILRVSTIDRWSLTGGPAINRVSGQTTYKIGAKESNFLGYGKTIALDCYFRDFDRDYYTLWYYDRRVLEKKVSLNIFINDDPEVGTKAITLYQPYYSLNSTHSFTFDYTKYDYRKDHYREGVIAGREYLHGGKILLSGTRRWGTYHSKVIIGAGYTYADLDNRDTSRYDENAEISFGSDSLYHYFELSSGYQNIRYIKTNRINLFTRDEDITLTRGVTFLYGWSRHPGSLSGFYDVMGILGEYCIYYKSNLILAQGSVKRWFDRDATLRRVFDAQIKYYNNGRKWYTLAIFVRLAKDVRVDGQKEVYLGENTGIRAYPKNYANGEKSMIVNIENRFFPNIRFSASRISPVQFVDIGSIWNRGENLDVRHMAWAVGVGLRISTERLASREAARIDLAYAGDLKTWQISFGLGQYLD